MEFGFLADFFYGVPLAVFEHFKYAVDSSVHVGGTVVVFQLVGLNNF